MVGSSLGMRVELPFNSSWRSWIVSGCGIQVLQPCSNIEIHTALKWRILNLSLNFGDLNIDLSLTNAAHTSPMLTSRSVDPTFDPRYLKSSTMLIGLFFMTSGSVGDKLGGTLISRPTFWASCSNVFGCGLTWVESSRFRVGKYRRRMKGLLLFSRIYVQCYE